MISTGLEFNVIHVGTMAAKIALPKIIPTILNIKTVSMTGTKAWMLVRPKIYPIPLKPRRMPIPPPMMATISDSHKKSAAISLFCHPKASKIARNFLFSKPQFNEEVQHLEEWPYGWYTRWIWEKDTSTSDLKRGTG